MQVLFGTRESKPTDRSNMYIWDVEYFIGRECDFTFWWGITGMGESILGVAVGTGAGRLDLGPVWNSKQRSITVKHEALCVP